MVDKKSTDADDVFEFLDSLPQSGQNGDKSDSMKDSKDLGSSKAGSNTKKDEDILDFLDELEKSNLSLNKEKSEGSKVSKTKTENDDKIVKNDSSPAVIENSSSTSSTQMGKKDQNEDSLKKEELKQSDEEKEEEEEEADEPLGDPISTFSNWWSSSGSATVSSFWNKTTEQASQLKNHLSQEQQDFIAQSANRVKNINMNKVVDMNVVNSVVNKSKITELAKNLQKIVVGETEEVLRIHLVHDLVNYPNLQYIIHEKFNQILNEQVQGGIRIFVDEWGKPNSNSNLNLLNLANKNINNQLNNIANNININSLPPNFNVFHGKIIDGEKLAFANLDNAIELFNKAQKEIQNQQNEAKKEANEATATNDNDEDEDEQIANIIDIFISILPIAPSSSSAKMDDDKSTIITDTTHSGNFSFTIILKDISNDITSITRSQGFPLKWLKWIENSKDEEDNEKDSSKSENATLTQKTTENKETKGNDETDDEDEDDGVNPAEWVQNWVDDGINLAFGTAAQNYVLERMDF
ncbi:hypothetical protein TBLA_0D05610 [Henningerozyma blattae CBS 6284]|uniref:Maintenance of telomere capping protein 1 n=1 Tax=Henningerozyma blattae (strain ATCC 34711 / CBS 6284 / DSM 70876 / NBRC 10599 / NRRL Y-10934 / UCD 77-7) TaxID=1071380 RepID=I2H3V1_HENB6|nr:hypothetical protein TBLA_0D05610 [Tetrapisispora blattae CBS 6284]CCH61053.1 hypothetical protein TBLA_0D05610 [Tetrapisispora blattae CBS 6284]